MKTLETLRADIDAIDKTVMRLLNERFSLMKDVKEIKKTAEKKVEDTTRETIVLNQANPFQFEAQIKAVYRLIIELSKEIQHEI